MCSSASLCLLTFCALTGNKNLTLNTKLSSIIIKEITAELAQKYNDLSFEDEDQLRSFFEGFSSVSAEALEILVKGYQKVFFGHFWSR